MATFLDLPLEIREQIYQYLLLYPSPDSDPVSRPSKDLSATLAGKATLHPAILSVSKQTHFEALPILYAQNTFLAHPTLLASFPSLRSPFAANPHISESSCPGVRLIRRWYLKARLDCGPFWTAEQVSTAFTGADELTVEVWQSMYDGAGSEVLQLFEGVRGVKKVRIWGSTAGRESYVRWVEDVMRSPAGCKDEAL